MPPTAEPSSLTGGIGPLGIIAGGGSLPRELAAAVTAGGRAVHVVAIEGEADAELAHFPHTRVNWGALGGMIAALRTAGCREIAIVGRVRRPDLLKVRPDIGVFRSIPHILRLLAGGDDSVLRRVILFFEEHGFVVRGVGDVAPSLVAGLGPLGIVQTTADCQLDIDHGLALIRALGPADVGQAVVVSQGRVIAVEAADGTDPMLERLALSRAGETGGILVKSPKPRQELRIDLPAIGPRTVALAAQAGLSGIAVIGGQVLIAQREQTIEAADGFRIFLTGVARSPDDGGDRLQATTSVPRRLRTLGRVALGDRERTDIARAMTVIDAIHPRGRVTAVAMARNYVLAIGIDEASEAVAARAARLRQWGEARVRPRRGALVLGPGVDADEPLIDAAGRAGFAALTTTTDLPSRPELARQADRARLSLVAAEDRSRKRHIFLVAGERSGDALGAMLMAAVKARSGGNVLFSGVGGDRMAAQGLDSLFPLSDVAVMGALSILPRLPRIVRRVYATATAAVAVEPDAVVIIDAPEFTHPIAKRIRKRRPEIPIVDYVSPYVWAWRPGRVRRMRAYIDHVLTPSDAAADIVLEFARAGRADMAR